MTYNENVNFEEIFTLKDIINQLNRNPNGMISFFVVDKDDDDGHYEVVVTKRKLNPSE